MNTFSLIAATSLNMPHVNASQVLGQGLNIALWGIGILSVAIIIYAAFRIITARGDAEKVKKGRLAITWGMVGLGVALMTGIIVSIVADIFG
jgi:hypothetical protein